MGKLRKPIYLLLTCLLLLQPFLTISPTVATASEPSVVTTEQEEYTVQVSIIISEETDEIPLPAFDVHIEEGDTALDALIKATDANQIELDVTGTGDMAYVRGIAGVGEFDRGFLSGWMFRVNDIFPNRGVGAVRLIPGDQVEFLYTTELGLDIGADLKPFRGNLEPTLHVDGLVDQATVNDEELVLQVEAESYFGTTLIPVVLVNDVEVPVLDAESIVVDLEEGENLISITVTDKVGHSVSEMYTVIYEEFVDEQVPEESPDVENSQELLEQITVAIDKASSYIIENGVDSEWEAIGVARAGKEVPEEYMAIFEQHIADQITRELESGRIKITDIERLAIAAVAIGLDPQNIQGYNLIELIYNSPERNGGFDTMTFQGNNGLAFALIALDTLQFSVPDDAKWTRQKLIDELLTNQNEDGSWPLNNAYPMPSVDVTGMALIGLSPYQAQETVKQALDRAVAWLSSEQTDDGGFDGGDFVGGITSEATSQVIIGLASYGIDPTSELFTKNDNHLISHLLSYQNPDGGFKHTMTYDDSDPMATEQALQALVAYELFLNGNGRLYDFSELRIPGVDEENEDGQGGDLPGQDDDHEDATDDNEQADDRTDDEHRDEKGGETDNDQDQRSDVVTVVNADQETDGSTGVHDDSQGSETNDHVLPGENEQKLPTTATNIYHFLLIGGIIMLIGTSLFMVTIIRKKKEVL